MSAKESDELFDLIQTLTKTERRYFKLHFEGRTHGELRKYLEVYDALASMKSYSREQLQKKIKHQNILKYYSKAKAYIIDAILDAMRDFYRSQTYIDQLYSEAANVRFLSSKGLRSQYKKFLQQAKQRCYEVEYWRPLLDLLETEDSVLNKSLQDCSSVRQEINAVIEQLRIEAAVLEIDRAVYKHYLKVGIRPNAEALETINDFISKLDALRPSMRGNTSRLSFNYAYALCLHMKNEHMLGVEYLKASVDVYHKAPKRFLAEHEVEFLRLLGNCATYVYNHRDQNEYKAICKYIEKEHKLIKGCDDIKFEFHAHRIFCEISLSRDYSSFRKQAEYFEQNKSRISSMALIRQGDLCFNVSLGYLRTGSPSKAIEWLLRLFEVPSFEERTNIYIYARMYEILLHWKLRNVDLVLSRTLSFKRYLQKNKRLGDLEKALIKFLNASSNNDSAKSFERALDTLRDDLQKLDKKLYAGIVVQYTDLIAWFTTEMK